MGHENKGGCGCGKPAPSQATNPDPNRATMVNAIRSVNERKSKISKINLKKIF
jgi:hypothetical protein